MKPFFVSVICLGDSSQSAKILISNPFGNDNLVRFESALIKNEKKYIKYIINTDFTNLESEYNLRISSY